MMAYSALFAIGSLAAPSFWTATIGTLLVLKYSILELNIVGSPGIWEDPWSSFQLFVIPAVAGGVSSGALVMRMLRSQLLDVLRQDYVRTARAKGLRSRTVILRHALRNALIPVLTVLGFVFATLVSGSVILEAMFNIPGMGQMMIVSLRSRDVPVVQGLALVLATGVVVVNLLVDIVYLQVDPRIQRRGRGVNMGQVEPTPRPLVHAFGVEQRSLVRRVFHQSRVVREAEEACDPRGRLRSRRGSGGRVRAVCRPLWGRRCV